MESDYPANTTGTAEVPPTEVVPKAKRRRFTASYKMRILDEAELCSKPGEVGALLRREGLYSSHLAQWRKQREYGAFYGSTQAGKKLLAKDEEIRPLRQAFSAHAKVLRKPFAETLPKSTLPEAQRRVRTLPASGGDCVRA